MGMRLDKMKREWEGYEEMRTDRNGARYLYVNRGVKRKAFIENWQAFKAEWWRPFHHLLDVRTESYRWGPYWSAHVWVPIEVITVLSMGTVIWHLANELAYAREYIAELSAVIEAYAGVD